MKWNEEGKVWEVSLRLHPQDLEAAMQSDLARERSEERVSIEDERFSELATEYLDRYFFIRRTPAAMNGTELKAILQSEYRASETKKEPSKGNMADSNRSSLKWIGMEADRGWLWIHLELTAPEVEAGKHRLWMIHRLFLDTVERQENSIVIDPTTSEKYSLQFREEEFVQPMKDLEMSAGRR